MDSEVGVHDRCPTKQLRAWLVNVCASRAIDLTAALVLATWGLLLLLPMSTFGGTGYAAFRVVGLSEAGWGLVFLAVALVISAGLAWQHTRLRMVGLVLAMGVFAFIATMFLVSNVAGFGWAGNYGYAALCLVALRRLTW
jgi:hypothetical protein